MEIAEGGVSLMGRKQERIICDETIARVRGRVDIMRAEQHIVNVAMGLWTERTLAGQGAQMQRLDEACAAYHALLEDERRVQRESLSLLRSFF